MNDTDKLPTFELAWREPRKPDQHQYFSTKTAALNRILEIRSIAREWTLFQDGVAIDWGYYER